MLLMKYKGILIKAAFLYMVNGFVTDYAILNSRDLLAERSIPKITQADNFLINMENVDSNTLTYLKLANICAKTYLDPSDIPLSNKINLDSIVANKMGDCYVYADFTYSNFVYMVKKSGNKNLLANARIALGYRRLSNGNVGGHRWIEYRIGSNWATFETVEDDFIRKGTLLGTDYNSVWNSKSFDADKNSYYPVGYVSIDDNGNIHKELNVGNALKDFRGASFHIYKSLESLF